MSSDQPVRTRQTASGSPVGSTIAVVITIVAVVIGFFVLKKIIDDDSSGGAAPSTTSSSTTIDPSSTTSSSVVVTSTTFPMVKTGTRVQVANASTIDRVAGALTTALGGEGFEMCEAVTGTRKTDTTEVQYDADITGAIEVARTVAHLLGDVEVSIAPTPVETKAGSLPEGCGVLVLLGNDKAGKTLAEMGAATTAPGTTATSAP